MECHACGRYILGFEILVDKVGRFYHPECDPVLIGNGVGIPMSEPQVLSMEDVDMLERSWRRAQPITLYQCVDINELATLSDYIPDLIATVRAMEAAIAELNNRIGNQSESINHMAHENKNLAWKNARLAGEKVNLQTTLIEAIAVIEHYANRANWSELGDEWLPEWTGRRHARDFLAKHKEAE